MRAYSLLTLLLVPPAWSCRGDPDCDPIAHGRSRTGREDGGCRESPRDRDWP